MGAKKSKKQTLSEEIKSWIPKYAYRIQWSTQDNAFVVSVEELRGCMTHGNSQEHALEMAHDAVEGYLLSMIEDGEEIPKPIALESFSGNFPLRMTPELHRSIVMEATKHGYKSVNKYLVEKLEEVFS
ncbi:MAG: type II toxin-antitoxin system HicB family antitoxin [Bdellovibrionales bacterium]|nr:type II toxin-antitoxin system HicB family antitoxin [Bdellovibrionales bacterium]